MELFLYIAKVTACSGIFYTLYRFLFSKLTFFTWNRYYLLFALMVSVIIPSIHFQTQQTLPFHTTLPIEVVSSNPTNSGDMDNVGIHAATGYFDWAQLAIRCYALISAILILRLLTGIVVIIYKAIRKGRKSEGYYLITNTSKNNSSFFNLIFLNDSQVDNFEKEQILAHELQHVRQWHSADQLFTELLKSFFWVNPFMYLIAKELKQVHEFQVDQSLTGTYKANNYANLLLKLMSQPASGLVNEFSAYGVKMRIQMLFHEQSPAKYKLRYFWLVPIVTIMGYQFSLEKSYAQTSLKDNFTLILDAGHGGPDGGVVCGDKYFEKDINLAIALQIKTVAEKRGIHTLLTRKTDEHVEFKDRVSYQGDVFASLHINGAPAGPNQQNANGIEIKDNPSGLRPVLSARFADQLKTSFRQLDDGINTNDSVYAAPGLYVLRENKVPAVLIEFGYGTNSKDLSYILDEQHRYAIAEKFIDAVIAYKNNLK
jgi:N-acetylmuramoyl-L-alanine amidase